MRVGDELQIINNQLSSLRESDFIYQEVLKRITPVINNLLDTNMNELMNILYRVDVRENDFKKALASGAPDQIGEMTARLILDRYLEKIVTRKKHSS